MQGNLILAKSDFSNSTERAGGNLWEASSEKAHPLSQARGRPPSSKSPGLQRLLRALNPHGALLQPNCSWSWGGGAVLHLLQ